MHQVVGSHNCDGASGDHEPLEDVGVELPPLTAAAIQALHRVTQQGLVLMKQGRTHNMFHESFRGVTESCDCFEFHF